MHQSQRPSYYAWAGYAFEVVCIKHIDKIVEALKIPMVLSTGTWQYIPRTQKDNGAQIDLLIERFDNAITICEIKYTDQPFILDKQYAAKIQRTLTIFRQKANIDAQIFLAFISASGLKETIYSEEMVTGTAPFEDLFKEGSL